VKFKLDENLGPSIQKLFLEKGLDCRQIREENLGGAADERAWRPPSPKIGFSSRWITTSAMCCYIHLHGLQE